MSGEKEQEPVIDYGQCYAGRPEGFKTNFVNHKLAALKEMVADAEPDLLETAGEHWGQVHKKLAGGKAEGGISDLLDKAVEDVLEHWSGDAARSFADTAGKIAKSIRNVAWYADLYRTQFEDAARNLRTAKTEVMKLQEPGTGDKLKDGMSDWSWDDGSAVDKDLAAGNKSVHDIIADNEGKIGASRETQLKAAAHMETLAANYARVTRNLKGNTPRYEDGYIKDPDGNIEYPPPVTGGGGGVSRPGTSGSTKPWTSGPPKAVAPAPDVPRDKGISGGDQTPPAKTKTDSIQPGLTGKTNLPNGSGPPNIPSGGGTADPGGNNYVPRTGPGVPGGRGNPGGRAGLGGPSPNRGGTTGRGGRPGMGAPGGAGGGLGRGGTGGSGRGALAKSRGGVVGAAKGIGGKGAGGGAGLHGSRGGTQRGMAGGIGGRNNRRGDGKDGSERPDYLVEDEETWVSEEDRKKNVPKNIE